MCAQVPSTGLTAIVFAQQMCDKVHIYGFANGACQDACYHFHECGPAASHEVNQSNFYTNVKASGGFHNFSAQVATAQTQHYAQTGSCARHRQNPGTTPTPPPPSAPTHPPTPSPNPPTHTLPRVGARVAPPDSRGRHLPTLGAVRAQPWRRAGAVPQSRHASGAATPPARQARRWQARRPGRRAPDGAGAPESRRAHLKGSSFCRSVFPLWRARVWNRSGRHFSDA